MQAMEMSAGFEEAPGVAIQLSGVTPSLTNNALVNMYRPYGSILRVKRDNYNGAHIVFQGKTAATKAVKATNGTVVDGKVLAVALVPTFKRSMEPCRGFAAGICRKGDACKYYHVTDNARYATDGVSSAIASQLLKAGREPCRDFAAGTCNRGDYCIYNHDMGTANPPITAPPMVATTSVAVEAKPKSKQPPPETSAEATPATKSKKNKAMEPCRRFAAGACYLGDTCKYSHAMATGESPSVVAPTIQGIPSSVVCRHFARGYCSVGAACRFAHVTGGPELPKPPTSETSAPKKKRPCLFFASGVCTRGDQCSFFHEAKEAVEAPVVPVPAASQPSPVVSAPKARAAAVDDSDSSDDSEEETVEEESRTCIECEKPGIAVWKCVKCENALYCDDCNAAVHRARVMAKHVRSKLPPVPEKLKLPPCGECETQDASVRCEQCEVPYCASCDASVHKFKSLRKHERVELSAKTEKPKSKAKAKKEVGKVEKKEKKVEKKVEKKQKKQKLADPTPVPYVESVPQLDLSSESESSESEAEVEDEEMPIEVAAVQQSIYSAPQAQQQPIDVSSESEEDDDEPMAPSPASASRPPVVQSKPVAAPVEDSEDSDDDFDDVKPQTSTPVAAPSKPSVKEASSDSESSSSTDTEDEAPAPPAAAPTPVRRTMPAPAPASNRPAGISSGSSHTLVKKIEAFHESGEGEELHLDSNLNGFERLLAHDCAERLGLAHESTGVGLERHITISRRGAKRSAAASSSQKTKKGKHHH